MMTSQLSHQEQQEQSSCSSPASVADRFTMNYHHRSANHRSNGKTVMPTSFLQTTQPCKQQQQQQSRSIPISASGIHRTASEVQLCEDEALADYRDYIVYSRIVNGISRQQECSHDMYCRQENDKCLAHIVSTRNNYDHQPQMLPQPSLQSLSRHIVQQQAQDDYYCGEDAPEDNWSFGGWPAPTPFASTAAIVNDVLTAEDDDAIFAMDL